MDKHDRNKDEIRGQILWFRDLLKLIRSGDKQIAAITVEAAIKLLQKKLKDK